MTNWLDRALRVRALAQAGRAYSRDPFDLERFDELGVIAEALLADLVGETPQRVRDVFLPEQGYPTPKVDVRAGVFRAGRILLVQEASDGRWSLPGGWADEQQSAAQSVVREVREESGFTVVAEKLVAVKDRSLHDYLPRRLEHVYKLFFLCRLVDGAPRTSIETTAAEFFALDALPALSIGRTLPADIAMLDAHRCEPTRATEFD
jgi:ADP-ribose pyrophosphatase YjhB (NUDIX family)